MAIDPSAIGAVTDPMLFEWTDRDTLLYALGVGAGLEDLSFTTENSHDIAQQVLPTYAVICCPAFGAAGKIGSFNWAMLLHGSQGIRLHAPLPAAGKLSVVTEVADLQDKGEGKNAIVMLRGRGTDPDIGAADRRDADHAGHPRRGWFRRTSRASGRSHRNSRTASPTPGSPCPPARIRR